MASHPFTSKTWIGGSGASCFTTNNPTGIHETQQINDLIEVTNVSMRETIKGKRGAIIKQVDDQMTCYTLELVTSQVLQTSQSESAVNIISTVKCQRMEILALILKTTFYQE